MSQNSFGRKTFPCNNNATVKKINYAQESADEIGRVQGGVAVYMHKKVNRKPHQTFVEKGIYVCFGATKN